MTNSMYLAIFAIISFLFMFGPVIAIVIVIAALCYAYTKKNEGCTERVTAKVVGVVEQIRYESDGEIIKQGENYTIKKCSNNGDRQIKYNAYKLAYEYGGKEYVTAPLKLDISELFNLEEYEITDFYIDPNKPYNYRMGKIQSKLNSNKYKRVIIITVGITVAIIGGIGVLSFKAPDVIEKMFGDEELEEDFEDDEEYEEELDDDSNKKVEKEKNKDKEEKEKTIYADDYILKGALYSGVLMYIPESYIVTDINESNKNHIVYQFKDKDTYDDVCEMRVLTNKDSVEKARLSLEQYMKKKTLVNQLVKVYTFNENIHKVYKVQEYDKQTQRLVNKYYDISASKDKKVLLVHYKDLRELYYIINNMEY